MAEMDHPPESSLTVAAYQVRFEAWKSKFLVMSFGVLSCVMLIATITICRINEPALTASVALSAFGCVLAWVYGMLSVRKMNIVPKVCPYPHRDVTAGDPIYLDNDWA